MKLDQTCFVPLSQGRFAQVDAIDLERVLAHKWHLHRSQKWLYAATNVTVDGKRKKLFMHRLIAAESAAGALVDHRDLDGLNNTRVNLRPATHPENLRNRGKQSNNTTGHKGVFRSGKKFVARIGVDNGKVYLGTFDSELVAAGAYAAASKELHGEFGRAC